MINLTNVGYSNVGNRNVGNRNVGDSNVGDSNVGNRNVGNRNVGDWNKCDYSVGYFNTETNNVIPVFNKGIVDRKTFINTIPDWLYNVTPTEFVYDSDMSNQEKIDNPSFHTTGGYLKQITMQEAYANAFNGISQEEIEKTKAMPFFDAEIFLEITGIDLTDKPVEAKKMTVAEVSQMLGYDIEIVKG